VADRLTIRVEGLEAARAALEEVLRAAGSGAAEALELIGQQGVTEIRRRAPVLTGRLRRSYTYEVGPSWVELSTAVSYAPAQELGTRTQRGTPHVRPGLQALAPRIPALIAERASRRMRGAGSRFGAGLPTIRTTLGG
jgi:hypothetical protein